ncbi:DUF1707 domain-containing protein [Nonomuraea angiospora]|uniref:Membrane protein n=1 Tax=Nonomuraea angiospora TaxID=46172 RepID=A0ABR9M0K8_9ACTN|nr:DUF1707 domain-containing protein [Nonomuraea angiospora]MBE1585866.1 putative membrane protein [Nonomuraea angiospora]
MDSHDLRIGDAEREQTMAVLREHFAQGRLTHEELDERLDQTLASKTARDLAKVTADLPGPQPAPGYREPAPHYDAPPYGPHYGMDGWREAMSAHRRQMQSMHQAHHDMRHSMHQARREMRRQWREQGKHPWRHHRGPHPFVGVLFVFLLLGLIFGGFGIFKVLFVVWLGAMVFSLIHRRFHHRR